MKKKKRSLEYRLDIKQYYTSPVWLDTVPKWDVPWMGYIALTITPEYENKHRS